MILKLTNFSEGHKGTPLLINTDYIVSVYVDKVENKKVTVVYGVNKETWFVKETIEQIYKEL